MNTNQRARELALPPDASMLDTLRWAVAHAALAPSELNSQPWLFSVDIGRQLLTARVQLRLDPRQALPALDPDGREGVLACGAALLNVCLALHGAGFDTTVVRCPDPDQPDLLADLVVHGGVEETADQRELRQAIPQRRTHRGGFEPGALPTEVQDRLVAEAAYEGASVVVLDDREREVVHLLNAEAADRLQNDPDMRQEVAAWSRANTSRQRDGVPGYAHGLTAWQSWLEPGRLRAGRSTVTAREQADQAQDHTPTLLVIAAAGDSRDAVLRAGAGMQRLLLRATHLGVAASYQNAALHVPDLRARLARAVHLDHPQVALRLGWGQGGQLSPRREEVLVVLPDPGSSASGDPPAAAARLRSTPGGTP